MVDKEIIEKYTEKMRELKESASTEELVHREADGILMNALEELGFIEMIEIYDNMEKWYE